MKSHQVGVESVAVPPSRPLNHRKILSPFQRSAVAELITLTLTPPSVEGQVVLKHKQEKIIFLSRPSGFLGIFPDEIYL